MKWQINDKALARLANTEPWQKFAPKVRPGEIVTPYKLYGPEGIWHYLWLKVYDSPEGLHSELCQNMGGGVPIEVIKEVVKAAKMPEME